MSETKGIKSETPAAVAGAAPCSAKCHYCESPALYVRRRFVIEKCEVEEIPMCLPCLERLAENTKQAIMQVTHKICAGVDVVLSVHPLYNKQTHERLDISPNVEVGHPGPTTHEKH